MEHRLLWSCCCRSGCGRQSGELPLRWFRLCWDDRPPGEGFTVEGRGKECDSIHAGLRRTFLAPIAGSIVDRGAKPGDVVALDEIGLTPFKAGNIAIFGGGRSE